MSNQQPNNQQTNNQKAVLTALGCAGSLAAMLAIGSPTMAAPITNSAIAADDALPALVQEESNPITDALTCSCAVCSGGVQRPAF